MFNEMRRADRQLPDNEIVSILTNGEYGILATLGENGYPYGIPISYVFVEQKIYFHCAVSVGSKVKNIEMNPKVCFTVISNTEVLPAKFSSKYESVVIFGIAKEVLDEVKHSILEKILDKYSSDYTESGLKYLESAFDKTAVYEISIDHITGKARKN